MAREKMEIKEKLGKGLSEKIAVYVPSTYDGNREVDNSYYVRETMKKLAETFGGATAYKAEGAWLSEAKGLIVEDITIVYSYTSTLTNNDIDKIVEVCNWLKKELKQEAISMQVNEKLYFI